MISPASPNRATYHTFLNCAFNFITISKSPTHSSKKVGTSALYPSGKGGCDLSFKRSKSPSRCTTSLDARRHDSIPPSANNTRTEEAEEVVDDVVDDACFFGATHEDGASHMGKSHVTGTTPSQRMLTLCCGEYRPHHLRSPSSGYLASVLLVTYGETRGSEAFTKQNGPFVTRRAWSVSNFSRSLKMILRRTSSIGAKCGTRHAFPSNGSTPPSRLRPPVKPSGVAGDIYKAMLFALPSSPSCL